MERADGKAKHVLVIDDDPGTLELYREVLEEEGFRATHESFPGMEPAVVAAVAPDLILLDLLFGGTTHGVSFLERLKATPETRAIPVLVCSADQRLLERLHGRLAAWDCGVLAKPFGLEDLIAAVQGCLSRPGRGAEAYSGSVTFTSRGE